MFFEMQSFLLGPLKSSTLPFKVLYNTVHAAAPPLITGKEPKFIPHDKDNCITGTHALVHHLHVDIINYARTL